jgi:hypothetical protein
MVALLFPQSGILLLVEVVAEGPPPLVGQARVLVEAMAVRAPSSPSQARPPYMLEEAGVRPISMRLATSYQAWGVQGVAAKAATFKVLPCPSLVLPTLVVGAGLEILEHQVAPVL